jgi:hypothetical protein
MERNKFENYCTVKQLEEFIKEHNLSGTDTVIVMQRVEDYYFDKVGGWKEHLVRKKGEQYHNLLHWNNKINDPELPEMTEDMRIPEEHLEKCMSEYYPCWCPVFYDNEFLYLDAHY